VSAFIDLVRLCATTIPTVTARKIENPATNSDGSEGRRLHRGAIRGKSAAMTHAEPQRHAQPTGRPGAGAVLAEQMDEAGGKRAKSRNIRPLGRLLPFLGRHKLDAGISALWLIGSTIASLALTATARGAIDQGFENGGADIDKWFLILGLNAVILGLAPALVVLAAITLLPLITLVVVSLTPLSLTDPAATFHFEQPAGNYAQLLQDQRFLDSLWVQAKLSSVGVLLQLLVGLGLALLLHSGSRLLAGLRTFFLIPMVLPPIVVALVWKIIYTPDISPLHALLEQWGWPLRSLIANPDTALWAIVVADVWQWFPFTMLMVLAQLQMVPRDPVDAARIDGANRWQVFVYIVLPYLQRTLVVCALFRLIDSFKAFPLLYVLTNGGPGTVTEVTNFYGFIQAFNFSYWGYGSAIAVVMLAIIFVLSALISRLGKANGERHAR